MMQTEKTARPNHHDVLLWAENHVAALKAAHIASWHVLRAEMIRDALTSSVPGDWPGEVKRLCVLWRREQARYEKDGGELNNFAARVIDTVITQFERLQHEVVSSAPTVQELEQWKTNSRENKLIAEENSRRADIAEKRKDHLALKIAALETWLGDLQDDESLEACITRHILRARASAARQTAEPLLALLKESRRKCITSCRAYSNYQPPYEDCTCGADAWNARVDAVLVKMQ